MINRDSSLPANNEASPVLIESVLNGSMSLDDLTQMFQDKVRALLANDYSVGVIGSFVSNSGMDENTSETSNNFPMIFFLSYTYFSTSTQVKPRFFFSFFVSSSFFGAWWSYTDRSASGFSL